MAEQESSREELEILSPDELRNAEGFLPELSGHTFWHKKDICDYCNGLLGTDLLVLQKVGRNGLTFMCLGCVNRLFLKLVD